MNTFSLVFLSILLEALPFVIIGTLVSTLIELYVSSDWLSQRLSGRRKGTYFLMGLMGLFFPVCECAIVPIVRRLIKKGMPKGFAITFMLAVPIVNPVVLYSTYYAFPSAPRMVMFRGILGYIGAIMIGMIMDRWGGRNIERHQAVREEVATCCSHDHCCHHHEEETGTVHGRKTILETIKELFSHLSTELYDVGRFLIMGALISASMQTFVPRELLMKVGGHEISSILLMMTLAFVISLCSEADAFIASTFSNQFSSGSIVAFLIFGPMIDIKNTLMLMGAFKTKFVLKLILAISCVCFFLAYIVNLIL